MLSSKGRIILGLTLDIYTSIMYIFSHSVFHMPNNMVNGNSMIIRHSNPLIPLLQQLAIRDGLPQFASVQRINSQLWKASARFHRSGAADESLVWGLNQNMLMSSLRVLLMNEQSLFCVKSSNDLVAKTVHLSDCSKHLNASISVLLLRNNGVPHLKISIFTHYKWILNTLHKLHYVRKILQHWLQLLILWMIVGAYKERWPTTIPGLV